MYKHKATISTLVSEVSGLNKQLILLQIKKLEDEIIPFAEHLKPLINSDISYRTLYKKLRIHDLLQKISQLKSLKSALVQAEQLCNTLMT